MARQWIRNALIVNGDGHTPAFSGDVLVEGDRIENIGSTPLSKQKSADVVIEAAGLVLCPGFVDTHNHGALGGSRPGSSGIPLACELALRAGVTKRICGVDGFSPAPVLPEQRVEYAQQLKPLDGDIGEPWSWSSVPEFYAWAAGRTITDFGLYLGHSAVRRMVMGNAARPATPEELKQMQEVVRREAPHTLGLSTGLVYNPAVYSDGSELAALLKAYQSVRPAAFFPHLRSESDNIVASLAECLDACVEAGAAYCNEHSKIAGRKNYEKISEVEAKLADGADHVPTMANMYPYTAGSTTGDALFPPEVRGGSRDDFMKTLGDPAARSRIYQKIIGDTTSWDNFIGFCNGLGGIQIAGSPVTPQFLGKRLSDVALAAGHRDLESAAAFEAVFDFFLANKLDVTIISHYGSDLIAERFFRRDDMAICTDGLMPGPGQKPHPRTLGSFPKAIRMAREMGISKEKMIWRMSTLPCRFLGLEDPVLKPGADASMVLLDWERVREKNDYENPEVLPEGIRKVWVHGLLAMNDGQFMTAEPYPGTILRARR